MATLVFPRNLQKVEYNATTAEGPCRVTVVNGTMDVNLQAIAPAAGGGTTERGSCCRARVSWPSLASPRLVSRFARCWRRRNSSWSLRAGSRRERRAAAQHRPCLLRTDNHFPV